MSTQHTSGPWGYKPGNSVLTIVNGKRVIARTDGLYWQKFTSEDEANARLIAAAPELLAAVEEAIASVEAGNLYEAMCCSGHDCGCRGSSNADLLVYDLRAAIAKARGQ